MIEPVAQPPARRRAMSATTFADFGAAIADVERLRDGGYHQTGNWTLAMICQHVAGVVEFSMATPADPNQAPTAEEAVARDKFFGMVFDPAGMPPNTPAPDPFLPKADAGPEQVDRLIAALRRFEQLSEQAFVLGRFGPISTLELRRLHLAHAAHHLSFLVPNAEAVDG